MTDKTKISLQSMIASRDNPQKEVTDKIADVKVAPVSEQSPITKKIGISISKRNLNPVQTSPSTSEESLEVSKNNETATISTQSWMEHISQSKKISLSIKKDTNITSSPSEKGKSTNDVGQKSWEILVKEEANSESHNTITQIKTKEENVSELIGEKELTESQNSSSVIVKTEKEEILPSKTEEKEKTEAIIGWVTITASSNEDSVQSNKKEKNEEKASPKKTVMLDNNVLLEEPDKIFSNYESDFSADWQSVLERLKQSRYLPHSRKWFVLALLWITVLTVWSLFLIDPKTHSIENYKATLLGIPKQKSNALHQVTGNTPSQKAIINTSIPNQEPIINTWTPQDIHFQQPVVDTWMPDEEAMMRTDWTLQDDILDPNIEWQNNSPQDTTSVEQISEPPVDSIDSIWNDDTIIVNWKQIAIKQKKEGINIIYKYEGEEYSEISTLMEIIKNNQENWSTSLLLQHQKEKNTQKNNKVEKNELVKNKQYSKISFDLLRSRK